MAHQCWATEKGIYRGTEDTEEHQPITDQMIGIAGSARAPSGLSRIDADDLD